MKTIAQLINLRGRKALVTGGAGHIGRAIASGLIELGAQVAIVDVDSAASERCAQQLNRGQRKSAALSHPCDLTDEYQTRDMVGRVIRDLGGLDILVHSAGYVGTTREPGWAVPFEEQSVEAWNKAMHVNVTSAFVMVQTAQRALAKSGRGSIIFLGSHLGFLGPDFRAYHGTTMQSPAGYSASKGALIQLARHMATLLAPRVRVNCLSPGGLYRRQPKSFVKNYVQRTPLQRMATEEDLKGAALFLASDLSSYVTGQNLIVDGGLSSW